MHSPLYSESKLISLMMRLGELVLLNLCFLLCCLPVVTIGAASTALYTVCFRFGTEKEKGAVTSFFRAFGQNLKQGIVLWLVVILFCGACGYITLLFFSMPGAVHYAFIPSLVLLVVGLIIAGYAFPLLSLFDNTNLGTLKNALILGLSYLPRSLCVAALNILPVILLLVDTMLFLRVSIFGIFLYFSAAAYLNTLLLRKVFAQFMPEEKAEE